MQVFFDDIAPGQRLPDASIGPISPAHIVRWSAAMENWHRIHYDERFARDHDGLDALLVNGSWKQHILIRYLADWAGEQGWLGRLSMQFRAMSAVWETLVCHGEIISCARIGEWGSVLIRFGMTNADGTETAPGTAMAVLPLRDGPALPYPPDAVMQDLPDMEAPA